MTETIITILSIYGLAFILKEKEGPFGLISKLRNFLFTRKSLGVFFYNLFDCYLCLGTHCGYLIYLIKTPIQHYHISQFILYALAGGVICLLIDAILIKLHK
jgi:hypothetical protein